jgi:WD40 repeat protein
MVALLVAALLAVAVCPAAAPPFVHRDAAGDPLPPGALARLGTLRLFHPGSVDFKAFTPDRRFLITATYTSDFRSAGTPDSEAALFCIWDLSTGRRVRQFGHPGGIHHAVQSPDGRRIVSVGPAGTFLLDVPSGRLVRQLEQKQNQEQDQLDRTAFRDEKTLVVVRNRCLATLHLADGRQVRGPRLFEENSYPLGPFLLSPDGKRILYGIKGISVVDTATGKPQGEIRAGEGWSVAFHPGGKVFAVEHGRKGTVQIHDAGTLRMLRQWKLRKGFVRNPLSDGPRLAFVPGGKLLATLGPKGVIDLWDWTTGTFVRKLGDSMTDPPGLTFSPDGKLMASGAGIERIRVFNVPTGKELLPFEGHRTSIQSLRYSDRNTLVSTALLGGTTFTWDVRAGRVIRSVAGGKYGDVLSPDGKVRARPGLDGTVLLLDSRTGEKIRLLGVSHPLPKPGPNDWPLPLIAPVAFSQDGSVLAYADPTGPILLWQVDTGKERGRLGKRNKRRVVKCLTFSRDGRRLAAGGYEAGGMAEVWDTTKGKLLRKVTGPVWPMKYPGDLIGPLGGVESVAFTPDGRAVAVKNSAGPVRLWEIGSGRQLLRSDPKPGAYADCTAVACSPDGRLVASAEWWSSIVLWEVASGREVGRFRPTSGRRVEALAFSPDGRILASAGEDPTILLWKIPDSARKPKR